MCGIAGIIDFRGRPIDRGLLERLCADMAHRGPDDSGIWRHESPGFSAALVHTRLAVIDPTPDAHQPMTDAAGLCALTYNGELYNYRELRADLPAPARTQSDTEVVLQACIAWGPSALPRFDAMWAMAFVDANAKTGHLSRDPFGIKPLYYCHHDDRLVFASEMSTLRRFPGLPAEIDGDALACYLHLGFVPHPWTIFKGVRKLPPGHLLRFDARGPVEPERFHTLRRPDGPPPPYADAAVELRRRVEAAVVGQRIADVPVGAFLSGGLDSSIVVACLARAGAGRVSTFSIGYTDHHRYDETPYARQVAGHFGTDHHEFRLGFKDILDTVEPLLNHLGEPFADSSLLPAALVSRHTRQHVTVALSGDGGDELFGGYWRYAAHHYWMRYHRLPSPLRTLLIEPLLRLAPDARSTRWLDRLRQARKLLLSTSTDPMERHLAWASFIGQSDAAQLLGPANAARAVDHLRRMYRLAPAGLRSGPAGSESLENVLLADLAIGLPDDMLHKVDIASMHHSLEVRVPFLSVPLVDYVTALPLDYRIAGASGKRILREAFRDVIPDAVLRRPKMGFEVPVGEFLRHELFDMYHDVVRPDTLRSLGLDAPTAARLYDDHARRRRDHSTILWALLAVCWWHRNPCGTGFPPV